MRTPSMRARLGAEALGTFWLVFGGCGSAVLASAFLAPNLVAGQSVQLGIGFLGVSFAFGLSVMTMAYAVGHVSGAHFNPAVTVAAVLDKRIETTDAIGYILAQVIGAIAAAVIVFVVVGQSAVAAGVTKPGPGVTDIGALIRSSAVEAAIVASSDPEEILEVADRIIVLADGAVAGEFRPDELDEASLAELLVASTAKDPA